MSDAHDLEAKNAVLVDALQSVMEISADAVSVDEQSIHHTAADALADLTSGDDLSAVRAAANVLVRHASAPAKWWVDPRTGLDLSDHPSFPYIVAGKMTAALAKLAAACDGHAAGQTAPDMPHRPALEVQLADLALLVGEVAGKLKFDLGGAIAERSAFDASRIVPESTSGAPLGAPLN